MKASIFNWLCVLAGAVGLGACAGGGVPRTDGSAEGRWVHGLDALCRAQEGGATAARPVVVDIDHTTVFGTFVDEPQVNPAARDALTTLDGRYGLVFLSANFLFDDIRRFLAENGYPSDAPFLAQPRKYWDDDYEAWCSQSATWTVCEYLFKLDRLQFMTAQCGKPERWIGLGDKFSDFAAYVDAGACPLLITTGSVREVNASAVAAGCTPDDALPYYFRESGPNLGERCPIVPDRYIFESWPALLEAANKYMSGEVACGAW